MNNGVFRIAILMATEEAIPKKGLNQTWKRNKDVNHPVSLNRKTLAEVKKKKNY